MSRVFAIEDHTRCPFCQGTNVYVAFQGLDGEAAMKCGGCEAQGPIGRNSYIAEELWKKREPSWSVDVAELLDQALKLINENKPGEASNG